MRSGVVTMQTLAREAGVSQSTVSLALRNDPRLSPETRKRIQALARKRKYRPDPALSALVAYRARTRPVADYSKIAVLHDMGNESSHPLSMRQQIAGIREQAYALGYDTELFRVYQDERKSMQLSRMLYARGVRGLILTAIRMPSLKLDWKCFSAVVLGEYFSSPQLNHVRQDHPAVLTTAYEKLRALGYRKIGYCNTHVSEVRKHHLYLGAYLKCLYLDGIHAADSPPLYYNSEADWSPLAWLERHRFDAVMTMLPWDFVEKLAGTEYAAPNRLALAGVSIPIEPRPRIAGCAIDYHAMGVAGVNLLQSMLHRGQCGVPPQGEHYDLIIKGHWRSGASVKDRRRSLRAE